MARRKPSAKEILTVRFQKAGCQNKSMNHLSTIENQVWETEKAFAASMSDRNFEDFCSFLEEDCIFYGNSGFIKGKAAVSAAWSDFFTGPEAPFSWEPAQVAVRVAEDLALSSGPVYRSSDHKQVAVFNSIWKQVSPGVWRIIFDKGEVYSS